MLVFYKGLLRLYPSAYRREYADEMISVFRDAQADISAASFRERLSFGTRESCALLTGAAQEHLRILCNGSPLAPLTRFNMHPEFRFPRSTVILMLVVFTGVMLTVQKAHTVEVKYGSSLSSMWPSLPWFLAFVLLVTFAGAAAILGILFALGQTGSQRLANLDPGVNTKD